jgi:hypothetical protein
MIALRDRSACTDERRTPARVTAVQAERFATPSVPCCVVVSLLAAFGLCVSVGSLLLH